MSWRGRLRDALWWGMERLDRVIGDDAAPVQPGSVQAGEPEDLGPMSPGASVLTEEAAAMIAPAPRPEQPAQPKPLEGTREATFEARMEQARRRLR